MNTLPIYVEDEREEFVYIRRPGLGSYWRVQTNAGVIEEVFQLPFAVTNINDDEEPECSGHCAGYEDGYDMGYADGYDEGRWDERTDND